MCLNKRLRRSDINGQQKKTASYGRLKNYRRYSVIIDLQNYLSKLILVHCKGVIMIAYKKKG